VFPGVAFGRDSDIIHEITSTVCKEALMGRVTEYYHAQSLEDAFAKARELGPAAAYLGGGIELVLRRNAEITTLIDLSQCGLNYIRSDPSGVEIGSQTTLAKLSRSADVQRFAGGSLAYWAGHIAHNNVRDMITVGGVIGRNQPWNDVVPHLIALGARVQLFGETEQTMLLADYIEAKRSGMIIKSVLLPQENAGGTGFLWRFTRTEQDISTLHFSALVATDAGIVTSASLVFAGRPGHAALYPQLSAEIVGKALSHDSFSKLAELAPSVVEVSSDLRATEEYRRELVHAAIVYWEEHMTGVAQ
jgi:carbon-monoxide dehydrogenase medium subunit